ncbi:hypothetical protein BKA67DRAFT_652277 [Truncatella angustata]|uniref:Uncharacterized protein n=1 Tax=Truncatella angustata TaxID=152316 RepID=A0A9P8UVL5_9PEZI|nr:uncharacterized protein BKA67DRAFT_652277 [Truncatella angustata]KAH6659010.1 hypothetical protein BKA67DRAFT_652277 [Truncatella angustata]
MSSRSHRNRSIRRRSRRNISHKPQQPQYYYSDYNEDKYSEEEKQQGGALSGLGGTQAILPKGDAVSAANNLNGATGALGNDAGGGLNQKYDNLGKRDTLSLAKLDLNLEVKGTLKTRIHGSLKLTLL